MNVSREVFQTNPYRADNSKVTMLRHQVRMEMVLDVKTERVNVSGVLCELMKRAGNEKTDTIFEDVNGHEFSLTAYPKTDTFMQHLSVEQVTLGNSKKVVLGFFIRTTKSFMDLKVNIGFKWLQDHKVFLRLQNLLFEHGTDLSLIAIQSYFPFQRSQVVYAQSPVVHLEMDKASHYKIEV